MSMSLSSHHYSRLSPATSVPVVRRSTTVDIPPNAGVFNGSVAYRPADACTGRQVGHWPPIRTRPGLPYGTGNGSVRNVGREGI